MPKRVAAAALMFLPAMLKALVSARFLAVLGLSALEDMVAMWLGSTIGIEVTSTATIVGFSLLIWFVTEKLQARRKK